ncbi:MAG: exo-alpha-sialidase, partial [Planctomycetes bacterium]|nr:exo-alpha-sialidase [Planctomycetota bacterium]
MPMVALILSGLSIPAPAQEGGLEQQAVFVAGQEGYHSFRIPALIVSAKGTVLAFCEGRRNSRSDTGDIDLVLKRSFDGGQTWGPMQVVADDGPNTIGNPCPVVDRRTGTIWLPLTRNAGEDTQRQIEAGTSRESRTVWMTRSTDDGATWGRLVEITSSVKAPDWTWYATGPGCGIQLTSGRL